MVEDGAAARSEIVASWDRCIKLHKLRPDAEGPQRAVLTESALREVLEPFERYMILAEPELQNLTKHVTGAGFFLSVANRQGVILTHRGALPERGDARWNTQDGMIWREDVQGTNAIGTALFSGRPTVIHRSDHFYDIYAGMSCLATPFFAPSGEILGALNIATLCSDLERSLISALLALVVAASQRIEALWFQECFQRAVVVALPGVTNAGGSVPLIAVDTDLRVLGATHAARSHFKIGDSAIQAGLALENLGVGIPMKHSSLEQAERVVLRRALAASHQNVSRAAGVLGISRATMHRKMAAFGISRKK
jgi:transcriptional regulator of acetoin/glycerol metabolism